MEKFRTINKVKSKRKHGFLQKMKTRSGRNVLKNRRGNKRKKLTV